MKKISSKTIIIILIILFWWYPLFWFGLIVYLFFSAIGKKSINQTANVIQKNLPIGGTEKNAGVILKCAKCDSVMTVNHKFCENCGAAFSGDNVKVEMDPNTPVVNPQSQVTQETRILPTHFDSMFSLSEEAMVNEFINRELTKAGIDKNSKLIPSDILKRRKILNIIFCILVFLLVSLIFFHFPIFTYIAGIVILFLSYKLTRMFNLMTYLTKQLKARPSEKVSNIVMSLKTTMVEDTSRKILLPGILIGIILPLLIFIKPIIIYEKIEGGYAVRYYAFGVTNFTSATIPEKHKNENIISLRGNAFSNMPFLKEVNLPDTIIEIRGQAFKNNRSLKKVKLPSKLTYLGGGAFYNCTSLESIELPDTLTYLGGEAFYNARRLKTIKLSSNLAEIRGSTFEYCVRLKSIEIPDSVTRIGGHAFYSNNSLSNVYISENSKLTEIGSSAFRLCHSLYEIVLPQNTSVNYRAFKESPTDIKRYGELETDNLEISNSNNYSQYFFMNVGETKEINKYISTAVLQDAYITLLSINRVNDKNEFNFKYSDSYGTVEFTLTPQNTFIQINDNLAIQINVLAEFVSDDGNLQFDAYYN